MTTLVSMLLPIFLYTSKTAGVLRDIFEVMSHLINAADPNLVRASDFDLHVSNNDWKPDF